MSVLDTLFGESTVARLLEITVTLIILYLVLSQSKGFASVMNSLSNAYVGAVKALQGR